MALWLTRQKAHVIALQLAPVQVVPGRAGGGSFRRKKNYIAKKKIAYRMCARRPNSAMPKPFLCCAQAFCCSTVVMWPACGVRCSNVVGCEVTWGELLWLVAAWHVMSCHVIWCSGHVIWCDVIALMSCLLFQYYSVLQSTTPVLLCTTQYHPVLQRTTQYYNVLLCTTKYYSSTTLYYKVLLQYFSVLQSTTTYFSVLQSTTTYYSVLQSTKPVLLRTTKYYSVLQSTTPVLQSTTLYYKVLLQHYSVLQSTTPALLCTTKYHARTTTYYSGTSLKRHLQCAEQVKSPFKLSKYCACHAKWIPSLIRITYETSFPMRGASKVTLQLHQILRLPRNLEAQDFSGNSLKCFRQKDDSNTFRPQNRHLAPAASETFQVRSWRRFCIEKYNISRSGYHPKCHELLRLPRKVTLQPHQILRLPCKMNLMIAPGHIWNVISNAQSKQSHRPTSPNIAPATQNECHQWSASQMKRHFQSKQNHRATSPNTAPATQNESHDWSGSHLKRQLQCAEKAKSTSNLTKYCTCHAKWMSSGICVTNETSFPAEQAKSPCNLTKYCACHVKWISWLIRVTFETSFTMRGASKVTLQTQQILRLPRKMNPILDPHHIWNVISNARSKAKSPSNFTKYCACHEILKLKISAETPWSASANTKTIRRYRRIIRR